MDPPIEVEQFVRFDSPTGQHSGNGDRGTGFKMAPAALLGSGVTMIVVIR